MHTCLLLYVSHETCFETSVGVLLTPTSVYNFGRAQTKGFDTNGGAAVLLRRHNLYHSSSHAVFFPRKTQRIHPRRNQVVLLRPSVFPPHTSSAHPSSRRKNIIMPIRRVGANVRIDKMRRAFVVVIGKND